MTSGPFKPSFGLSGGLDSWTECSRRSFAFSRRPLRLDLHPSLIASCVVAKTAPLPVLRTFAQPSRHRIAMNVAQLFHKLRIISNIEIVIPLLPEMLGCPIQACFWLEWVIAKQTPRYSLLQRLQRVGQRIPLWFAKRHGWPIQAVLWLEWGSSTAGRIPLWFTKQQMNMLRHDDVPVNLKLEAAPHPLQR